MKNLSQKIAGLRCSLGMSQKELAEAVGVSLRSVQAYEGGEKTPRQKTLFQLARVLKVSAEYLSGEEPDSEKTDDTGSSGTDINRMLAENEALFSGNELSQAEKDIYFDAIMTAYVNSKQKAREKFGKK